MNKANLTLKQFMVRQEVLRLYRDIHRTIRKVPDKSSQLELREWARRDFKQNKSLSDPQAIKSMILIGQRSLKELKTSLELSGLSN